MFTNFKDRIKYQYKSTVCIQKNEQTTIKHGTIGKHLPNQKQRQNIKKKYKISNNKQKKGAKESNYSENVISDKEKNKKTNNQKEKKQQKRPKTKTKQKEFKNK